MNNCFSGIYFGKRVLVTGHTGFKGAWLSLWLRELGATVCGVSDAIPTDPSHFEAAEMSEWIESKFLDIRNVDLLRQAIVDFKPDIVFHMAAQALVRRSYIDPLETFTTNAIGTVNVLESLHDIEHACTAVIITSDKCYENIETHVGYRETDKLGGKDPYSASKAAAELAINSYRHSYFSPENPDYYNDHVKFVVTRAGNVIGGGDWAADRLIPDLVKAWATDHLLTVRRPRATRPWQHVLEPLSGYLQLGASLSNDGNFHGEAFNFGPPADAIHPVSDVVSALQQHLSGLRIEIDESDRTHEAGLLSLNCEKAQRQFGWKTTLDFDATMRFTADWYANFYHGESAAREYSVAQLRQYVDLARQQDVSWSA